MPPTQYIYNAYTSSLQWIYVFIQPLHCKPAQLAGALEYTDCISAEG